MNQLSLALVFVLAVGLVIPAFAVSITNVQVEADNIPISIPSGTPSITSVSVGSWIHGKIETLGDTQVESSLNDFVYAEKNNGYTTTLEFDGQIQNNTSIVNLIENGQTTYSLVFTPISVVKPIVQNPNMIPSMDSIPIWLMWVMLIGSGVGAVVFMKSRQGGVKII